MNKIITLGPTKVDYHWSFPLTEVKFKILGIYGRPGSKLPKRMCYLHPDAIVDFAKLQSATNCSLIYSDMYRKFSESLSARRRKGNMVAFPGDSGHNWGISFDIDVDNSINVLVEQGQIAKGLSRNRRMLSFYDFIGQFGWKPMDWVRQRFENGSRSSSEEWHFNNEIIEDIKARDWARGEYSSDLLLDVYEIQSCLNELGYKVWPIDGVVGNQTKKAIKRFQKDYDLVPDGIAGIKSQRTLACFCSDYELFDVNLSEIELEY